MAAAEPLSRVPQSPRVSRQTAIVTDGSSLQSQLAATFSTRMLGSKAAPYPTQRTAVVGLDMLGSGDDEFDTCIFVVDVGSGDSTLNLLDRNAFAALKQSIGNANRVFWITSGAGSDALQPEKAMVSGFGCAVMLEQPGLLNEPRLNQQAL
ncbi:hypothetical protein F5Y14DRAFT_31162 [Nemania sp. NC0429]|nr:hypothetical protein F5Y14DRAFT_31162 [Nemania sp. NC0429]